MNLTVHVKSKNESKKSSGKARRRLVAVWSESIGEVSRFERMMETAMGLKISTLTPGQLLGPLNDVESKFAPPKLYAAGPMEIPLSRPRTAIIGSRKASTRGLDAAVDISRTLAKKGVIVVSGLAKGIDTAAHRASIEAGGRTIAVLGTPLDHAYPSKNSKLQREIMANHLAISQYPIGHPTRPKDFVFTEPDDGIDL